MERTTDTEQSLMERWHPDIDELREEYREILEPLLAVRSQRDELAHLIYRQKMRQALEVVIPDVVGSANVSALDLADCLNRVAGGGVGEQDTFATLNKLIENGTLTQDSQRRIVVQTTNP